MPQFVRLNAAIKAMGTTRSRIYKDMELGLVPRPVKVGARASALLDYEVQALVAARASCFDADQIKNFCSELNDLRLNIAGKTDDDLAQTVAKMIRKHSAVEKVIEG